MRNRHRVAAVAASITLAASGLAVATSSADAALTTYCSGEASGVTVPGDLVVRAGDACVLTDVTIQGTARVQAGADLILTDSTVDAAVVVAADGYFEAVGSELGAGVTNNGGYGVYLESTSVEGAYVARGDNALTFVYADEANVGGRLLAEQGEVFVQSTTVGGAFTSQGSGYTDVLDSTLARTLTVEGNANGSVVCGSEVDGDATWTGNAGVQLGTGGTISPCDDANYFGGNVTISDSTGGVDVSGNIIRGDLNGDGNDPAPTGADNRVRGESGGQFAELSPAAQLRSSSVEQRAADLQTKRDDRRASATGEASEVGPANL
ncbi:hypothetical protein [Parenemella sanctibonifatiensis]|uniref:Right-handed parallel beta-helix repeat-containing protein n=1 Tax=Parenemella sanctibonifatiensis TaxID=2016505 RepID=A0A255EJC5_9ACTN|nr:hypothetical protein [Parenemella sanctibonifatiensis]OYN91081.1 hypothetical protein CGZ91_06380 [Parenemella sanctibonifatiensis]